VVYSRTLFSKTRLYGVESVNNEMERMMEEAVLAEVEVIYYPSTGYRAVVSTGIKLQEREADHSPPSSAEFKNDGAIPPIPDVPS
jgi:hypothetical protein